jgi:hypothetical protein
MPAILKNLMVSQPSAYAIVSHCCARTSCVSQALGRREGGLLPLLRHHVTIGNDNAVPYPAAHAVDVSTHPREFLMLNVEGPVTIYTDTRKAIRILGLQFLCVGVPTNLLLLAILCGPSGSRKGMIDLLPWSLLAVMPLFFLLVARSLTHQTRPIVSLSSLGITVNTLGTQVGFLCWSEIKDVYVYCLDERYVGITLNDPGTVYGRIGLKGSWLLRMNRLIAQLFKPFRIRVAPINIPQGYLPMSADELLTQIKAYRAIYS